MPDIPSENEDVYGVGFKTLKTYCEDECEDIDWVGGIDEMLEDARIDKMLENDEDWPAEYKG